MLSIGTSSDRIFTPPGYRSYFATLAKTIPATKVAPYVGVSWSEFEQEWLFPVGLTWQINPEWSVMPMSDGRNGHLLLTYSANGWAYTAMLLKGSKFGVSVGVQF